MKKRKIIVACACLCFVIVAVVLIFKTGNSKSGDKLENDKKTFAQVKEKFESNIQELKDGKYNNLVYNDFEASIDSAEGLYNIEIQTDNSYKDRTFLENFEIMKEVIDKFFMEDFDKSYIVADFAIPGSETVYVGYNDIEKKCGDEKYNNTSSKVFLFGNGISDGGYMVQIAENLQHAWFSRGEIGGNISPFEYKKVYPYISGIGQGEDVEINLKDGMIKLSEMEEDVLTYLNNDFPLPLSEEFSFGIGDVRILDNGEYDGISFKVRRIYKGIPFEYGSNFSSDMYIDSLSTDDGEIAYAVSAYPDTMLTFGRVNGTVVETETVSEVITLGDALSILSEKIGKNSTYDVHGVELVYRSLEIPEERRDELDGILVPKWKIITINQNDDKYTIFYVDVVTGEVMERFEYYYE